MCFIKGLNVYLDQIECVPDPRHSDKREVWGGWLCTEFKVVVGLTMIYCYYIDTVSPVSRYMRVILLIPEGRVTPVTASQSEGPIWTVQTNQKPGIAQVVSVIKKSMLRHLLSHSPSPDGECDVYGNAEMSPGCDLWSVMSLGDPCTAWANISITPAPPICTSYKYQAKETFILRKYLKSIKMSSGWAF